MTSDNKNKSHFWPSYSDLMTSLFFIMLVMFIVTIVSLRNSLIKIEKDRKATKAQLQKVKEIEEAVNNIDSTWFTYNEVHKKHVLNIEVEFRTMSADISNIPEETRQNLVTAGNSIVSFLKEATSKYKIQYLLIIEGQTSRDNYVDNFVLSYNRALALYKFWQTRGINFDKQSCEVIISGSGCEGSLRALPDIQGNKANQRFLIHIVPKPGIIEAIKDN